MGLKNNKIKWDHVNKHLERTGVQAIWKAYGMPEVVDPFTSRYADIDPMPRWAIPDKVHISVGVTGGFFSRRINPNQPVTVEEIRDEAEACIKAGAQSIDIHVRDASGFNKLSLDRFKEVVLPLKEKYPDVGFDGGLVAASPEEGKEMELAIKSGLFEVIPVNTSMVMCGDSQFVKPPHAYIRKAAWAMEAGCKPQIAVYTDGDIDNARRYLIDSGLLEPPYYWIILPALPGCSPMNSPLAMVDGLTRMVRLIREIDQDSIMTVCAPARASTYLATLAMLMGLHVRAGVEDTVFMYPHKDDLIPDNRTHFNLTRQIGENLGRSLMSAGEFRALVGLPPRKA